MKFLSFSMYAVPMLVASAQGASISTVDLFRVQTGIQTANAQPGTASYFLGARVFLQNPGDFNTGSVTTPAGSVNPFTLTNPTTLSFGSPSFATLSAFNAAFPTGTYTYDSVDTTLTNPNSPQTVSLDYAADAYPTSVPFLTNFNSLTGLNPGSAFLANFDAFTGAASIGVIFFDIRRHSDNVNVFNADFLPSSTASALIPSGTLQANTQYDFDLIFSNRVNTTFTSGSALFNPQLGFDIRTDGSFVTGSTVPEPATAGLAFAGLALGCLLNRRRLRSALQ